MAELTFKPRARLMLLLGDQLIRDPGIAVFELVKNAYDADATECTITLENIHSPTDGRIIVEDNGTGMTMETVKKVWLSPGTRFRLSQREKTLAASPDSRSRKGRLPIGEKGVGRFAVHKLGYDVKMITRSPKQAEVLVTIDWKAFDNDDELSKIPVKVNRRIAKHFRRSGTRIEITNLRDAPWTRRRVRDLYRAITSICSPTEGPEGFKALLQLDPDPDDWLKGLLTSEEVKDLAIFRFTGRIVADQLSYDYEFRPLKGMRGLVAGRKTSKALSVDLHKDRRFAPSRSSDEPLEDALDQLGTIKVDFHVFDRDAAVLKFLPGNIKQVTEFLDVNGGVRVYRDGVRVYDFGEPGNDWLDLGGRRINVPTRRVGNNQILGAVHLRLDESQRLVEKTNREGFVENTAYRAFRAAVGFAIVQLEAERNADKARIRKATAKPRNSEPVLGDVSEMRDAIEHLKLDKEENRRLAQYLDRIEIQYRDILDRLLTAAGAGLNLSIVLHEVEKGITSLYSAIRNHESEESILDRAKQLADIVNSLTWLTRKSGISSITASALIEHCIFAWSYRFQSHGIHVVNGIEQGDPDFTFRASRRLLMTALMNLIDNAIYWVGTKRTKDRQIYIGTTYELTDKPAFVVADNGPGFQDPPDYLRMPFFTRKPDGMGLGLHIADEIMKLHEGALAFPEDGEITLPKPFNGAVIMLQFGDGAK